MRIVSLQIQRQTGIPVWCNLNKCSWQKLQSSTAHMCSDVEEQGLCAAEMSLGSFIVMSEYFSMPSSSAFNDIGEKCCQRNYLSYCNIGIVGR
jgi:hypothetical protein